MEFELDHLLKVEDYQKELTLKTYNATEEQLLKDIQPIMDWYDRQPHLPRSQLDERLAVGFLLRKKYSLENTKTCIDLYFSYKNYAPEFYCNRIPRKLIEQARGGGIMIPLPKLDSQAIRTNICRIEKDVGSTELLDIFRVMLTIGEFRASKDICLGDRLIFDCTNITARHLLKIYPSVLKKGEFILKKIFGVKVCGIHIIIPKAYADKISAIAKALLTAKLQKRLHIHGNIEDIYSFVPKDLLPNEYGGKAGSYYDIIDNWEKLFATKEFNEWFNEQANLISDESKRVEETIDFSLSLPGSFRQLNVD